MTALADGLRQTAHERKAQISGFELVEQLIPEEFSIRAANKAIELLSARPAPAGSFPVVFHPSITGLLVHEALGHNAEADQVWTGESILEGKVGQKIASSLVTIVDDPGIPDSYGSYKYDSEGTAGQRRVIIEKGVLKGFLHSLETASKFGTAPNGAARAQNYAHYPVVRMSNTFMEPARGEAARAGHPSGTPVWAAGREGAPETAGVSFEDIIKPIERGIFLDRGQWGYVFVERGQYTCHAGSGRMIEHGRLGEPLRDVSVAGLTLETLKDIEAISSDFEMDMPGFCGKAGQGVPVNAGGPFVRVKSLVVGGQS
jgi:TldD protein